jgi:hypothetical protein
LLSLKKDWNFQEEAIAYLKLDLLSLYEIIKKANRQLFLNLDVSITDNLTISGLASRIFKKKYYKNKSFVDYYFLRLVFLWWNFWSLISWILIPWIKSYIIKFTYIITEIISIILKKKLKDYRLKSIPDKTDNLSLIILYLRKSLELLNNIDI